MNFQEIKDKLKNLKITPELLCKEKYDKAKLKAAVGSVTRVASYGGEGQGETYYTVDNFVDHNIYIRVDAFYSSYDGPDFDDSEFLEVLSIVKTITVYEAKA